MNLLLASLLAFSFIVVIASQSLQTEFTHDALPSSFCYTTLPGAALGLQLTPSGLLSNAYPDQLESLTMARIAPSVSIDCVALSQFVDKLALHCVNLGYFTFRTVLL